MKIKLETPRLVISPRTLDEMRVQRDNEADPEMKQAFTELIEAMQALEGREEWGSNWKIALQTGEIVGGICFKGAPNDEGEVEIGYGTERGYENNGYMTEAVGTVTEWALSQDGVKCVKAETLPDNIASQRVLLKNGFVRCENGYEGPIFRISKEKGVTLYY